MGSFSPARACLSTYQIRPRETWPFLNGDRAGVDVECVDERHGKGIGREEGEEIEVSMQNK